MRNYQEAAERREDGRRAARSQGESTCFTSGCEKRGRRGKGRAMSVDKLMCGWQLVLAVTVTGLLATGTVGQAVVAGGVRWHVVLIGLMTAVSVYGIRVAWKEWREAE